MDQFGSSPSNKWANPYLTIDPTDIGRKVNTLSGWIMEELGQIPKEGDSFVSDGVKVVVLKMDDHRVDKAKVYQNVQNNAENEGNQEK